MMDKLLVVQDSPSVNAMLRSRLEAGGFAVDTVETGEEGVERAKDGQYRLILLDYTLPGIDGVKVCHILRGEGQTRNIPILFVSAKDEDELRKITDKGGANGYISVPFDGNDLVEKVKNFIGRHRL